MKLAFFNNDLDQQRPAVYMDGELALSFGELNERAEKWACHFASQAKQLILIYASNEVETLTLLLGALSSGNAVMLAAPELDGVTKSQLESTYKPHWIASPAADGKFVTARTDHSLYTINPDLSLLLSTSGSTGSAKYVRLSENNILANAVGIANTLDIDSSDIAVAHLDIHYSYGLSVLTSHLLCGAAISFSSGRFTDRPFWQSVERVNATHLPGVPIHYEFLNRFGFSRLPLKSVRTMTQAGGPMSERLKTAAHEHMTGVGGRFFVMYGQTEAAPRMSTLPHSRYMEKKSTVGQALPGGSFTILDDVGNEIGIGETGNVCYSGPNVMAGYASGWSDLALGDEQQGKLMTGDVGLLDAEGFLTITGRTSRYGKILGWRVSFDELESFIGETTQVSVVDYNDKIFIVNASDADSVQVDGDNLKQKLRNRYPFPASVYRFETVGTIPLTARNKTDYNGLRDLIARKLVS